MAIKRWNANTSTWELVGTPGTVTPAAIGAAVLSGDNTFLNNQIINGNVSIGTTNNYGKIVVNQSGQTTTASFENTNPSWAADVTTIYKPNGVDTSLLGISARSDGSTWLTSSYGAMLFRTGTNNSAFERMRITTAGRVSINTSTELCALNVAGTGTISGGIAHYYDVANYPNMRGWIEHIGQAGGLRIISQGANLGGDVSGSISFWTSNSNSASTSTDAAASEKMRLIPAGYLLIGYTGSNGAYRLQVNSQIFATSSSIATSDGRYKENVLPITSGLDIIDSLNPVSFNWKEHPVHNFVPGKTVGFIAQEVKEALKDYEWVDNIIKTNYNEELDEEFLGIAEANIIPLLVAAVKELRSELNTLKSSML